MAPDTIAHYRITSKLGEGGMGAVYRATDTKLGRDVAIKILPDFFASDADRLARFAREAQVLASLNHPHIAAIYGVEDRALVMELVPGATLADRIAQAPLPLDEALPIARQIVEALEYAHEHGVVHRDLKPANVKITPEGIVKVLDFGLAKVAEPVAAASPLDSPTLTMHATQAGIILGTAAYMSPEQASGKPVDRRADVWSFGVLLCEMLTGRMLFRGETMSHTLAEVLKAEPDLSALPARVRPIVERCVRKDPRRRWQAIGDVRIALEEEQPAAAPPQANRSLVPWALLAIVAAVALWGLWRATRTVAHPLMRLSADLGPNAVPGANLTAAISPDGMRLAFTARGPDGKTQLATRLLDQSQPTLLPGTDDARDPFFSPDGQWIGFFTTGSLKKISVQGGAPVRLCDAAFAWGASWGEDGNIIFSGLQIGPLLRVPATGGSPQLLTKMAEGSLTHRWPQILPGGEAVLFSSSLALSFENGRIEAVRLKTGESKTLLSGGYFGRYLPSGHLVYFHQGVLFGVAFDANKLELRGSPVPLLEDMAANAATGGGQFDFSRTGALAYLAGKGAAQSWGLMWLESSGKMRPVPAAPANYFLPRFSPDGRRLALNVGTDKGVDLVVYDFERDTMTRLTSSGDVVSHVWSSDGKYLAFATFGARQGVWWARSDGGSEPQKLAETKTYQTVLWSASPDGRRLAYHEYGEKTGGDLWILPLDLTDPEHPKVGKREPFLRTAAIEAVPAFSPDGRWIAYRSDESGSNEVYVRPYRAEGASPGGKWQISSGGALYGIWSNNGRELFYETPDNRIMVLDYSVKGESFVPGKPRLWSAAKIFFPGVLNLDLAPDGKRFVVFATPEAPLRSDTSVHLTFLLNFFDELKRRIPAGGK